MKGYFSGIIGFMLEEEISELVEGAKAQKALATGKGHALSCVGATAAEFMAKGRMDLLTLPKGNQQIPEEINSYNQKAMLYDKVIKETQPLLTPSMN